MKRVNRHTFRDRRAFTLTELLVIIGIIVLLMILAVPAFSSMIRSANRARADTQLQVAVSAARDAAVRTINSEDTCLAFFYDLSGGIRAQVMVYAGEFYDNDGNGNRVLREIFVPDPLSEPFYLPKGWSARGYVPPGVLRSETTQLFEDSVVDTGAIRERGHWVFPETAFYDGNQGFAGGRSRQSFVLRFKAGSGRPATSAMKTVLLLDPSPWINFRGTPPYSTHRADDATDKVRFIQRVIAEYGNDATVSSDLLRLLGDDSIDTVLAAPAREVALYRELDLAAGLGGVRLDRLTGTIYANGPQSNDDSRLSVAETVAWEPAYVRANIDAQRISEWIEGTENGAAVDDDDRGTRLYTLDQSSGSLREVTGDEG